MPQPMLSRLETLVDTDRGIDRLTLAAGTTLVREGDVTDGVYVLIFGSLTVAKMLDGGSVRLAHIDKPGTVVGEMVALGGGPRTATVTADQPSDLYRVSSPRFQSLLSENPDEAEMLAAVAVRRAEEGELAELMAERLGPLDDETLLSACADVQWFTVSPGDLLFEEGEASDAVYFVIRGRFRATRTDPVTGDEVLVGESAKDDIIGELGVTTDTPRLSTVAAVRHGVAARMSAADFLAIVERKPRLMVDIARAAISVPTDTRSQNSPSTVIAVAAPWLKRGAILTALHTELSKSGVAHLLSSDRIDAMLSTPGVAGSGPGDVGDVRVSRLIHELELESDHLILDLGVEPTHWTTRALGLADRILLFAPALADANELAKISGLVSACPSGVGRSLVVEHATSAAPTGSKALLDQFSSDDVMHVVSGSTKDLARVARVAAGKGNTLVLGGGGARGFGHLGAYRALSELGFAIDIVGGSSVGGVLSSVIGDGHSHEEVIGLAHRYFSKVLDYTLPVVSLIKGERIADAAFQTFGDRDIADLRSTFFCVSTDLTAARPHVHRSGSVVTALRATSAIPGVMPPVPLGDALLIDGGVLNNLPIDIGRAMAPGGRVVAIDVAPPRGPGAHGDYGLSVSGWKAFMAGRGSKRSQYPGISSVLMRSMITASMRERDRQVVAGLADFYINLDMRGTSLLDFTDLAGVANKGYDSVMPALEAWMAAENQ